MLVEIKDNQIVIKISEAESNFLTQKALQAGQKDVCSYVKAQLLEALGLQNFEARAMLDQADEFDLTIIKQTSSQLNRRRLLFPVDYKSDEGANPETDDHNLVEKQMPDPPSVKAEVEEDFGTANVEVKEEPDTVKVEVDDLLGDLLDKDLLKGGVPVRTNSAADIEAKNEAKLNKIPNPASESKADEPPREPKSKKRSPN